MAASAQRSWQFPLFSSLSACSPSQCVSVEVSIHSFFAQPGHPRNVLVSFAPMYTNITCSDIYGKRCRAFYYRHDLLAMTKLR